MEENLGVIEQSLGVIFVLRYSGFPNFWWLFCLDFMGYEIGDFKCSIQDLSMFNSFFVCYNVSIMLVYSLS